MIRGCISDWPGIDMVEKIEITWPSGKVQTLENIKANQILEVKEP